jgi:octaheme c-type cytochrome (tetrathionate reductase family)
MRRAKSALLFVTLLGMTALGAALLAVGLPFEGHGTAKPTPPSLAPPEGRNHLDHAGLMTGPFTDGPSVTRACLKCHPQSAQEVMKTSHYAWLGEEVAVPGAGHSGKSRIGKRNLINNFCLSIESNWDRCTSCHAGYGWKDGSFAFDDEATVDCLVCHDGSGTYRKAAAGNPAAGTDLAKVAASVARPTRQNCGTCHFAGGGGDAVKHGDLDGSLTFPGAHEDVHMGEHNLQCIACHRGSHHQIPGKSMSVSTGLEGGARVECSQCHGEAPHQDRRINEHVATIACVTCHIPIMAVDTPTKLVWDWSTAGKDVAEPNPHRYLKEKGSFVYAKRVVPEYYWFNGTVERYLKGDRIDPTHPVAINRPLGGIEQAAARIYPFKVHRGKQPYDTVNRILLAAHTTGADGYWKTFDWKSALLVGAQAAGLPFSGQFDFAATEMYWPLAHMVRPGAEALGCVDCHGPSGRLDWRALGYEGDAAYRGGRQRQGLLISNRGGAL